MKILTSDMMDFQVLLDRWENSPHQNREAVLLDAGHLLIRLYDRGYWDGLRDGRRGE